MGEKLLAQRILLLLRETQGRGSKTAETLIEWAAEQADWLWPDRRIVAKGRKGERLRWDNLAELAGDIDVAERAPPLFGCVDAVAELLQLEAFEREVLAIATALSRLTRLSALRMRLLGLGADLVALVGMLAGAEPGAAASRVRRSAPLSMGLLQLCAPAGGGLELYPDWRFARLIDEAMIDEERLIEALAGRRQTAALGPEDFADRAETFDLLARMLRGALVQRAAGINLLIYGPPGTGKTEFARTLAAAAGASLFAVGECDEDGEEPSRYERLHALRRAQRLLGRRADSLLLFDEMEDLFAEAEMDAGGERRAGSKIFVNRLLEENRVPTIWTSNSVGIDCAHLRRLTYVLKMDHPGPRSRARILSRVAASEGSTDAAIGLAPLVGEEEEVAAIARVALRGAALAGGGAEEAAAVATSLLTGIRGGRPLPPRPGRATTSLDLYDPAIAALIERLAMPEAPRDFSLLLTGPPGTGKTALAAHLADRLDRPLSVKRTSDLFSAWVGETEANIAKAFAEARERGAVLLFDEADSLLGDRADAQRSWEISQVNEMLTWMDNHPLPFVAATNFARRLDPAALRRFVFKLQIEPLSPEGASRAWRIFFGDEPPLALADLAGLTPGDFSVVQRQLRYAGETSSTEILERLEGELRAKPDRPMRIGF